MKKIIFDPKLIKLAHERGEKRISKPPILKKQFANGMYASFARYYLDKSNLSISRRERDFISIKAPKVFSFIDNPEDTIGFIDEMIGRGLNKYVKTISINQSECSHIDLCAETVTSVLLTGFQKHHNKNLAGLFPKDEDLKRIVLVSGITKNLGISRYSNKDYSTFDLIEGAKSVAKSGESSKKEISLTKLINYIDTCLKSCGWSFTRQGKQRLGAMAGEVIDNAEQHSGLSRWWIQAYQHTLDSGKCGECHLVMFNFGKSIYETMRELKSDSPLRIRIESLIAKHSEKKLFHKSWDAESLWTLYSLQEGSSRLVDADKQERDRGQGLSDLVQYFQKLGQSSSIDATPKMSLVSGHVYINFDNQYRLDLIEKNGNSRRQIAFNEGNNLELPPDSKYVKKLESYFPGTIFSLKFYIDNQNLQEITNEN